MNTISHLHEIHIKKSILKKGTTECKTKIGFIYSSFSSGTENIVKRNNPIELVVYL